VKAISKVTKCTGDLYKKRKLEEKKKLPSLQCKALIFERKTSILNRSKYSERSRSPGAPRPRNYVFWTLCYRVVSTVRMSSHKHIMNFIPGEFEVNKSMLPKHESTAVKFVIYAFFRAKNTQSKLL
jgi:hypothetical protein